LNGKGLRTNQTFRIQIDGGPSVQVDAAEDALLRGMLRAGLGFPHECSVGSCGACRFELLSGSVATLWPEAPGLSDRERKRGKRLACQSQPQSDCTIRARCDAAYQPAVPARRATSKLLSRRKVSGDMCEFTFLVDGVAEFRPGQYALLHLPGVQGARSYSMSNLPNPQGIWQFVIRRTAAGRGSQSLFERLAPGDELPLDGPYGHAFLRPGARDVVCIAGGAGLAPMLSIARAVRAEGGARRLHLFLGLRSQADLGAVALLDEVIGEHIAGTTVLSAPDLAPAWSGAIGFIHSEVERAIVPPLDRFDFYFAGPPPMVDAVQDLLMVRARVPNEQIRFDRFL
jgi:toluene monooxygenase electron transfer component